MGGGGYIPFITLECPPGNHQGDNEEANDNKPESKSETSLPDQINQEGNDKDDAHIKEEGMKKGSLGGNKVKGCITPQGNHLMRNLFPIRLDYQVIVTRGKQYFCFPGIIKGYLLCFLPPGNSEGSSGERIAIGIKGGNL